MFVLTTKMCKSNVQTNKTPLLSNLDSNGVDVDQHNAQTNSKG